MISKIERNEFPFFSENCLIGFDGVLKLCDFGFARTLDEGELSRTFCGSTVYAAPEVLSASEDYNPYFSDVWSCGIVLYAMFTAQVSTSKMVTYKNKKWIIRPPEVTKSDFTIGFSVVELV